MLSFPILITRLKKHYGEPKPIPASGPFELVMWENACYLLPDERRVEVFERLRREVGLTAAAIAKAPEDILLAIAERGGMRPGTRVFRWRQIAEITSNRFGGNLDSILDLTYAEAKKALKLFPAIGDPGAEKILLLCGVARGLPLESNALRVLSRIGWGSVQKDYGSTYRSVQEALKPELPAGAERLKDAHLLLRVHGKTLCKDKGPLCYRCPVADDCDYTETAKGSFLRD
jgi:endonuclease-3